MTNRQRRERRETLAREQRDERFSTGGLDFRASLRRVLAGGRGETDKAEPDKVERAHERGANDE